MVAAGEVRRADRKNVLLEQERRREPREISGAPADQRVGGARIERVFGRIGVEQDVDFRMARLELADPADEPGRGERRARVDHQKPPPFGLAHRARRPGEGGEPLGEPRRAGRAGLGQRQAPARPRDQRRADLLLQRPHLLRDCGLGDMQVLGRPGERQLSRHRLEGPEGGQRRQAVDRAHRIGSLSIDGINIAFETRSVRHTYNDEASA